MANKLVVIALKILVVAGCCPKQNISVQLNLPQVPSVPSCPGMTQSIANPTTFISECPRKTLHLGFCRDFARHCKARCLYVLYVCMYACMYVWSRPPSLTPPHGLGPQVAPPFPFYLQAIGSISEVQPRIC